MPISATKIVKHSIFFRLLNNNSIFLWIYVYCVIVLSTGRLFHFLTFITDVGRWLPYSCQHFFNKWSASNISNSDTMVPENSLKICQFYRAMYRNVDPICIDTLNQSLVFQWKWVFSVWNPLVLQQIGVIFMPEMPVLSWKGIIILNPLDKGLVFNYQTYDRSSFLWHCHYGALNGCPV